MWLIRLNLLELLWMLGKVTIVKWMYSLRKIRIKKEWGEVLRKNVRISFQGIGYWVKIRSQEKV